MQALELAVRFREDLSSFGSVADTEVEPTVDPQTPISTDISPDIEISIDLEMPNAPEGIAIEMEVPVDVEITTEQDLPAEQGTSTKPKVVQVTTPWWGEFVGWMTAFYRGDLGKSSSLGSKLVTDYLTENASVVDPWNHRRFYAWDVAGEAGCLAASWVVGVYRHPGRDGFLYIFRPLAGLCDDQCLWTVFRLVPPRKTHRPHKVVQDGYYPERCDY